MKTRPGLDTGRFRLTTLLEPIANAPAQVSDWATTTIGAKEMKSNTIKKLSFMVIFISLVMMILSLLAYKFNFPGFILENHSGWGEFGSFIGGISSPFAIIIGFCGVLITLIINSEQSVKNLERSNFFSLVDLYIRKKDQLITKNGERGEQVFEFLLDEFNKHMENALAMACRRMMADGIFNCRSVKLIVSSRLYRHDLDEGDVLIGSQKAIDHVATTFKTMKDAERWEYLKAFIGPVDNPEPKEEIVEAGLQYFCEGDDRYRVSIFQEAYDSFYDEHGSSIGHHFRNMSQIFSFMADSQDVDFYRKIFRAQLSRYEISMLLANGVSNYSDEEFASSLLRYKMTKGIYVRDLHTNPSESDAVNLLKAFIEIQKSNA